MWIESFLVPGQESTHAEHPVGPCDAHDDARRTNCAGSPPPEAHPILATANQKGLGNPQLEFKKMRQPFHYVSSKSGICTKNLRQFADPKVGYCPPGLEPGTVLSGREGIPDPAPGP